jgi:hypothetical protein
MIALFERWSPHEVGFPLILPKTKQMGYRRAAIPFKGYLSIVDEENGAQLYCVSRTVLYGAVRFKFIIWG